QAAREGARATSPASARAQRLLQRHRLQGRADLCGGPMRRPTASACQCLTERHGTGTNSASVGPGSTGLAATSSLSRPGTAHPTRYPWTLSTSSRRTVGQLIVDALLEGAAPQGSFRV